MVIIEHVILQIMITTVKEILMCEWILLYVLYL
jgi:hypothetical protein